ncbi:MAG: PucR family transcriptional regulator, purine catabolism regulatory protein [Chloroflexota bacterium]|nr:PucR family transcriptional regulator, purine catabolism regulatory protein [Chloroflexota bacterium]
MTDLAALAAELLPAAEWIGGAGRGPAAGGRSIAWVRVLRARVPAFDALDPGDRVIAPASSLAVVAPGERELAELVGALAAVPVSGVLLVEAEATPTGSSGLDAAAAAIDAAGIPGFRLARTDPAALERSLVGFIVARGAEIERQASLLEAELRRRALEGGGIAALVATVSAFLGRALAVEARRGDAIVVHAPAEAASVAGDAARYQARPSDRGATALRVPLPSASGADGAILVLGQEPVTELARVTLPRVAGLLALELAREEAVRGAADRARRAEPVPAAGPPWVVVLACQREPGAEDDAPAARESREALRRAVRLLAPARRMSLRGDADSLEIRLVVAGTVIEADRLAERVGETLGRTIAVSSRFALPADRAAAEAEARATLEAALALDRPPAIARADRLAVYRMLGALHKLPDGERLSAALLAPLLDARPDVRRERLQTLRAYLGNGGVGEAAAALGVHRNTIAYRLRRIEAATGWRLADPELRLPLAAALELVQEEQV